MIGDLGPALKLFRVESERLELSAPFSRQIAESLDADAAGQAAFNGCLDQIGREEGVVLARRARLNRRQLHWRTASRALRTISRS